MNKNIVNPGFTLIECLVALFIIALVLASATRTIGLSIEDVRSSYVREVASWVASNEYNKILIDAIYPSVGTTNKYASMADIDYVITENIYATPNPYFRKIEILVKQKNHPDYVVFRTTNYIAQY